MEDMLKVNDLFCGCGGFGLGFKQAGFRLGGAWDFDKWAVESYGHNVSPKVKQADITQMTAEDIPYADVWTFGFPCQDLSVAGKQAGMVQGKTRSGLFYEVMRLLHETNPTGLYGKPKIIMAENVKGLKPYLSVLEEEYDAAGYKMYYSLFNSKYWGVPQNRERYFVVGVRKDIQKEFVFPTQQEEYVPKLSSVLEQEVDEKYYIDNEKAQKVIEQAQKRVEVQGIHACLTPERVEKRQNGRRAKAEEEEMYTLTAQDYHGVIEPKTFATGSSKSVLYNRKDGIIKEVEISPTLSASDWRGLNQNQSKVAIVEKVANEVLEIAKKTRPNEELGVKIQPNGNIRPHRMDARKSGLSELNVCYEENEGFTCTASHANKVYGETTNYRVRKLTPREYARLQGFPDSFKIVVSNTQAYKQFGNAVSVPVAKALAETIKEFLGGN